jgi:pimeloyl-ACP methyl ester carboxylesterase
VAPAAAPACPLASAPEVAGEEALGVDVPVAEPVPDAPALEPDAPEELPGNVCALDGLSAELPAAPDGELEDCANDAPANANIAAAVAAVINFSFNMNSSFSELRRWTAAPSMQRSCLAIAWHETSLRSVMYARTQMQFGAAAALAAAAFVNYRAWQTERANPPAGRLVEVDGMRLHYMERGEGPPLVMLHGRDLMIQELALSGLFELATARYRVIAIDRPGYGHSERPRGRLWTPQSQAALLHAMLARIGVERPILFGHSFGAMVAAAYAIAYPTATRAAVLASGYYFPTVRPDVPLLAPPAIPVIGDVLSYTISPLVRRLLWPYMLKLLFSPAPVPRYFERFPTWMALRPRQLRASAEEAAALIPSAMALQRHYREITVPTVIVAGAQDRYVNHARHSAALSRIVPGSTLLLSPRAGHMVHHVDPRRVLQAIELAAS